MTIIEPRPHPANVDFVWEPITREPRLLTAEQVRQFDEQGYVLVPDVIEADAITEVRDAIDTATGTRIRQDDPTRQFPVLRHGVAVAD